MPRIASYFIRQNINRVKVDEYLAQNFYTAGYAGVQIIQSGLGTRVHIFAERPALIIGRRGATIRKLQAVLVNVFGLENAQISVSQPEDIELNARIQAFRVVRSLEMGYHYRRVAMATLRRIMEAGAAGVEVTISGKLGRERAHFAKYQVGRVIKTGDVADRFVDRAVAYARLPQGIIGVEIRIVRPEAAEPHIKVKAGEELETIVRQLREELGLEERAERVVKEIVGKAAQPPAQGQATSEVSEGGGTGG